MVRNRSCHVAIGALVTACFGISVSNVSLAASAEIAFTSELSGGLYVLNLGTLSMRRESLGLTAIGDLVYSAPNKMLALSGSRRNDSQPSLFLLKWPGTKLQRIPYPKDGAPYRPQFDPAGKYLYAVNYGPEVFRYSLKSGDWTRIPVEGAQDLHTQEIALAPSGHLAAISPADFKGFLIAEVAPDRFHVLRRVLADFNSSTAAHWIDDSHIVFLGRKTEGYQFAWSLNLATGQLVQLTHLPLGTRDFLSLSRDGHSVVFTASDTISPAEWTLWRLDLSGKEPTRLTHGSKDGPFLSPVFIE